MFGNFTKDLEEFEVKMRSLEGMTLTHGEGRRHVKYVSLQMRKIGDAFVVK